MSRNAVSTTLGAISRVRTGKLDANAKTENGEYPFFTCGEEILKIDHYAFDTKAVLLAGNGNFNVKWYEGKFNAYQRTYVIEPNGVLGRWFYYAVVHLLPKITKGNRGSTVRFIRIGDIIDCPVLLPSEIEQRRVVVEVETQLSRLDASVAALKRVQANLKRYRASVLHDAFAGRLTRCSGPWASARLGDVAKTASGGTPKRGVAGFYGGEIPWIKSGELGDGLVRHAEEAITSLALDSSAAKIFPKGTVCIALYGATVGKVGILDMDAATNQAVCGVFPNEKLYAKFVFYFLWSQRPRLVGLAKGGAQPNISQDIVRGITIPLPPLSNQRAVVAEVERRLSVIERLEATVTANLKRSERLRQSILSRAFSVAQGPSPQNGDTTGAHP